VHRVNQAARRCRRLNEQEETEETKKHSVAAEDESNSYIESKKIQNIERVELAQSVKAMKSEEPPLSLLTHVHSRWLHLPEPFGEKQLVTRKVAGIEFVRGFLQHTLPSKLQKLRYYGFASFNSKLKFAGVQMLVWFHLGWCYLLAKKTVTKPSVKQPVRCAECGSEMRLVAIFDIDGNLLYNHSLSYLDSG